MGLAARSSPRYTLFSPTDPATDPKLYYYATEAALNALWDQEIKVTSPCDFNDPFEFLPATKDVTPENRAFCQAFQGAS